MAHSETDLSRPRSCRRSARARCERPGFSTPRRATRGRDGAAGMAYERGGERARIGSHQGSCRRGQRRAAASHRIWQIPAAAPAFFSASAGHRQARSPAIHFAKGGRSVRLVLGSSRTNARHRARSPAVMVATGSAGCPPALLTRSPVSRPAAQSLRPSPLRIGRRIRPRSRCDRVCVLDETRAKSASAPACATDST